MTRIEVAKLVQKTLDAYDNNQLYLTVINVSEQPLDGYWYAFVEPELKPEHEIVYYRLLSQVEEDLVSKGIRVLLTPSISRQTEYEIDGHVVVVKERESGAIAAMPKHSHGGPHFSATYLPTGERIMLGTVLGGDGPIPPPPEEWVARFDTAVEEHLRLKGSRFQWMVDTKTDN